jgi:hypothetical protein
VTARRLAVVRVLVGTYAAIWLAVRLPHHLDLAGLPDARWEPVGFLSVLDSPPPAWLARVVAIAAVPAAVALAAGWRLRASAPACAVTLLAVTTYASSWGQLFHTENLLVLHVVVLAGAALAGRPPDPALVLRAMLVVTAAVYVVAGLAKVRNGGWDWVTGDALAHQVAFDNLRKAVIGAAHSPLGAALVPHAWVFAPMALGALAVELGAPVLLLGRRAPVVWAAAAWLFHVGVLALMAIAFPYQLAGVAFAPGLPVERIDVRRLGRRWSASSSPSPSSPPLPSSPR